MPATIDVATLPEELKKARSVFEMWELTGLAQTAVAQNTQEVKTSVDNVRTAVTDGGQHAVAAIDGVKQATGDLKTSVDNVRTAVTDGGQHAVAAIDGVKQATGDLKMSVDNVRTAVTDGGQHAVAAIDGVKQATGDLKMSVDNVKTAVTDGAERISGAIYELTLELRNLRPILERAPPDAAEATVTRQYEFFKITALEDTTDTTRAHLDQLEKTVAEAIRSEKLAAFLEHTRRWEDLGSSPKTQRRPGRSHDLS
jgi:ABC-type transporter Mla subunit MlaD